MNWTHDFHIYAGKKHPHPMVKEGDLLLGVRTTGSVTGEEIRVCINRMLRGQVGRVTIKDIKKNTVTTCTTVDQLEEYLKT